MPPAEVGTAAPPLSEVCIATAAGAMAALQEHHTVHPEEADDNHTPHANLFALPEERKATASAASTVYVLRQRQHRQVRYDTMAASDRLPECCAATRTRRAGACVTTWHVAGSRTAAGATKRAGALVLRTHSTARRRPCRLHTDLQQHPSRIGRPVKRATSLGTSGAYEFIIIIIRV